MADHVRKQIRDAMVAALDGLTTTGSNVFSGRVYAVQRTELPCLLVYFEEEGSEIDAMGTSGRPLDRQAQITVEGVARVTTALEDTLDAIAKEVEAALGGNRLGGLARDVQLSRTRYGLTGEGDAQHGAVRLTWAYDYRTPENDPTTTV